MDTQYWREQREMMEKMASDTLQALDAYGKQYDSAYKTDQPQTDPDVPHGWDTFATKKIKYTPEQEDEQDALDDNREAILALIGKRIQENGGTYDSHNFPELMFPYHFDEHEAKLIHDYPRLLDAMKEDSRRDRGGILFHFANSLHLHNGNHEKNKALYDMLSHDLDHHKFWGWKDTVDPDDYEPYVEKSAAYWRGQCEAMEKLAAYIYTPHELRMKAERAIRNAAHNEMLERSRASIKANEEAARNKAIADGTFGKRTNQNQPFTIEDKVDKMDLFSQHQRRLFRDNITHVHQLTAMTPDEVKNIPDMTSNGVNSIKKELERVGLSFKKESDYWRQQRLTMEKMAAGLDNCIKKTALATRTDDDFYFVPPHLRKEFGRLNDEHFNAYQQHKKLQSEINALQEKEFSGAGGHDAFQKRHPELVANLQSSEQKRKHLENALYGFMDKHDIYPD
jgi:hypothetical protein